eukprot:403337893
MITLIVMYGMIAINIISLFFGMLQNPGIHQIIYDLYLKKYQKSNGKASRGVNQDEESGLSHRRINRSDVKDKKELRYCRDCDFWYDRHTYHCEDCEVCIQGYDHHCIFFGKCIGQGNIWSFWITLAMVFACFIVFCGFLVMDFMQRTQNPRYSASPNT